MPASRMLPNTQGSLPFNHHHGTPINTAVFDSATAVLPSALSTQEYPCLEEILRLFVRRQQNECGTLKMVTALFLVFSNVLTLKLELGSGLVDFRVLRRVRGGHEDFHVPSRCLVWYEG
jgi:hypothetical protein